MKKISTVQTFSKEILKGQKLTIGLDLGDRWSFYCILDEAGKLILEQKVPTTPEGMKQTFARTESSPSARTHVFIRKGPVRVMGCLDCEQGDCPGISWLK
jgi:hypothetical protein